MTLDLVEFTFERGYNELLILNASIISCGNKIQIHITGSKAELRIRLHNISDKHRIEFDPSI